MKKIFYILALMVAFGSMSSCDSFLDQEPIDRPTKPEDIFSKRATTEKYLNRVYSFIPRYWTISSEEGWGPLSDEADVSFQHDVHKIHNGAFSPAASYYKKWGNSYNGIREATYFLKYVHLCKELNDDEMKQYTAEAKFLRAYYHFLIMRNYGPVVLMGDILMEPDADGNIGRSPFDACVSYVSKELKDAAGALYTVQTQNESGRITKGAALALRARLLLYAASPLFNPTDNKSIYASWKSNTTGENLMPTTYSEQKWKDAAAAAKEVIDMPQYELMEVYNNSVLDPYASLYKIYTSQWSNKEIIFGRIFNDKNWYYRVTPRAFKSCWGGYNPTQKQVDAYAMNTGVYPITGYEGATKNGDGVRPIIDPNSGYSETGTTNNYVNPFDKQSANTYNMYINREPRFYINITWSGMKLPYDAPAEGVATKSKEIQFYKGGNSGSGASGDKSVTGYSVRKMLNHSNDPDNDKFMMPMVWPMIRLAEVYLNYVEALIEYDYQNSDVLLYWNKVRFRAGVPNIEDVYPGIENDQTLLREMIRRERQVELSFENHRYFDSRRWLIAEETNNGPVYGMDILAENNAGFFKRTPSREHGSRIFRKAFYLHPIEQWELDRNTALEKTPLY